MIQDTVKGHPSNETVISPRTITFTIVMGTFGKSGFDRFLIGSIAEKIVKKLKVPVLVVWSEE